ncbi:hydroxyacid dehydrogenase [Martelella mediterranea]|uniref:hydroxyacid dehydrogenase n=1 Tax=Martelella mediterranea TaxID=293089 RepID=UPI001E3364AF|nr:hydroxyacid dehydrogenase [Martelella mediterranea]MCD1636527.1 hydroxyacid dehydrogenase [Martelella mediterranea]
MMRPRVSFAMAAEKTQHVFDERLYDRLGRHCEILSVTPMEDFTTQQARDLLAKTDILVTGWGSPFVGEDVLRLAPRLRLIAHAAGTVKYTIGEAVYAAGIAVTNAAAANAVPVAEYTLAAIIFANKKVFDLRDAYRRDRDGSSSWPLMSGPIGNYRRTVGLIGASRIGRRVAELLEILDVEILLHDPYVTADDPIAKRITLVDLDSLLRGSDTISLHAPALPATRHMIGAAEFSRMRDGATFINTARGMLVDHEAMIRELESGRISAILDVTAPEMLETGSPLYTLPNVFLTPHVAGAGGLERLRLGEMAVSEIERFISGHPLEHAIQPELLERSA